MIGDIVLARLLLALGIVAGLPFLGGRAQAQEFSADLVSTNAAGQPDGHSGKIFVSNRHVRIETPDLPDGFLFVDGDHDATYFVRPAQRVFMDAKQSSRLTQLFVPVDPHDPCRQWQAMARIAGAADGGGRWRCERVGQEAPGEGDTIEYLAISPQDQRSHGWIDPRLKFLIRLQAEDGTAIDLENIRQGQQPSSLFEIPAGYHKFDPLRLIERIKQSDVWVEPPQ